MTFRDASAGPVRQPDTVQTLLARYGPSYRVFAVLTTSLATLASLMPTTMINVALPDIMGTYSIGPEKAQALSAGYLAASTAAMLATAWMVESFGMRFTMVFAMIAYAIGSLCALSAPDENFLIAARVMQGAAAGLVMPLSMQIVFEIFPENRRATAMGIFSVGVMMTPAIGPSVGGLIIDNLGWRFLFPFEICLVLSVVPFALLFMPSNRAEGARAPFDGLGVLLLAVFLVSLLYGFTNGQRLGWNSDLIISIFVITLFSFTAFIYWENRVARPLMDLAVLKNRQFVVINVLGFFSGTGMFASTILLTLFLQVIQGYSATEAGASMIIPGITLAVFSVIGGMLGDRFDPRLMIITGTVLFGLSNLLWSTGDANTPYATVVIWMIIGRMGIGLMSPSLSALSLAVLPPEHITQGAGITNFIRQMGGAIGVNFVGVYLTSQTIHHTSAIAATQDPSNATTVEMITRIQELLARSGLTVWEQTMGAMSYLGRVVYYQAHMLAFRDAFLALALVYLVVIVLTFFLRPNRSHKTAT